MRIKEHTDSAQYKHFIKTSYVIDTTKIKKNKRETRNTPSCSEFPVEKVTTKMYRFILGCAYIDRESTFMTLHLSHCKRDASNFIGQK